MPPLTPIRTRASDSCAPASAGLASIAITTTLIVDRIN
jgi:hypothetical protein